MGWGTKEQGSGQTGDPAREAKGWVEIGPNHPAVRGKTGRGVSVAVIDSGIHVGHPHVGGVVRALGVSPEGILHEDGLDRLGHGTAVAAAVHEKAPEAELHIVRVFETMLSSNLEVPLRALEWAAEEGIRLVNLSLGTANPKNAPVFQEAVDRLLETGAILVSASIRGETVWYPGSLRGVVGVELDLDCPREWARFSAVGGVRAKASGLPRPIPGVPPRRNLNGVSFSVANVTGILACAIEGVDPSSGIESLPALLGIAPLGDSQGGEGPNPDASRRGLEGERVAPGDEP